MISFSCYCAQILCATQQSPTQSRSAAKLCSSAERKAQHTFSLRIDQTLFLWRYTCSQDVDVLSFFLRRTQGWQNNNQKAIGNTGLFFQAERSRKISTLCLSTEFANGVQKGLRHIRSVIEDEICKLLKPSAFHKDFTQWQIQQNHITCWTIFSMVWIEARPTSAH